MAKIAQPVVLATTTTTTTDVFQSGDFQWKQFNVDTDSPKPLLVFAPTVPGTYTVILFCHGFCVRNSFYSSLLAHITSHGFIVVAPQLVYLLYNMPSHLFIYVFNIHYLQYLIRFYIMVPNIKVSEVSPTLCMAAIIVVSH